MILSHLANFFLIRKKVGHVKQKKSLYETVTYIS